VSAFAVCIAPSTATIRRIINRVCPGGLADLLGWDPSEADSLAVDGKSARGSRHGETPAAHLLVAMTGGGLTVTQLRVPDKTNEITCFADLLATFDLTGVTVTADALHAQRGHARFLVEEKKAHYALCVKKNQAGLYERLQTLSWREVTAKFYDRTEGHGRRETRVVQVLTVDDLDFPHAAQVARVVRHRTCLKTGRRSRETVYIITDLTSREASPTATREDHPFAVGHRKPASLRPRHRLPRRRLQGPHRARSAEHGHVAQLRDQLPPCRRPPQHRRRTPRDVLQAVHPPPGSPRTPLTSADARTVRL
jgi:predicted transposase YbfD/YdcC